MDIPAPLEIHLLGGFRVAVHGRPVPSSDWRQRRAAGVIKMLALASAHRLHREQLIEALWPELDGEAAANNLRVAIHRARRRLESAGADPASILVREGDEVTLASAPVWIDVDAYEEAASRAWLLKSPAAAREALDLYSGELLPEDIYEDWAADRRLQLRASSLTLLAHLAQLHEQRDELGRAIAALQRLLVADPLDEAAHAALIRLFARAGDSRQAITQYARLAELLDRELGAEPEPAIRDLVADIRAGHFPGETQPLAPAVPPDQPVVQPHDRTVYEQISRLPAPVDDPIGREREIAEVRRLLGARRLVTLTGPAGVGKTRLGLAVAQLVAASHSGGASFVELAPLQEPELVLPAIAHGLGVRDAGGPPILDAIAGRLGDAESLLVLDNFEHLTTAAQDVADLLACCPGLRILVTSRVRLRLRGEQEYPVHPLATPGLVDGAREVSGAALSAYPAVALFVQRARDARPDLHLTDSEVQAVAEICRRLDGLPLAIELAAARLRVLTPAALLARLERPLAILTGGRADAPRRQQTLRAAIAWSHDLLSPAEQALFARLSVFAGGWSLEALAALGETEDRTPSPPERSGTPFSPSTPSPLDLLTALVEQSLVQMRDDAEGTPRYSMLETIREFAAEQSADRGETDETRRRHARFFLALAESAAPMLTGGDASLWCDRLERDIDNLRAALATFTEREEATGLLHLSSVLWRFWWRRGYLREGSDHLTRALELGATAPVSTRAEALDGRGVLAAAQGDLATATTMHGEALRLWRAAGDRFGEVRALTNLGLAADEGGNPRQAAALLQEALDLARQIGDRRGSAVALANLGQVAITVGDHGLAVSLLAESVAIFRELGAERDTAAILANLGVVAFHSGDLHRARLCHEEALALFRTFGDRQAEADEMFNLGHTVQQAGDLAGAETLFSDARAMFVRLGDRSGEAFALNHLGRLAHLRGDTTGAEQFLQQGVALAERTGDRVALMEGWEGLASVACATGNAHRCARLLGAAQALREETGVPLPAVHQPALAVAQETALTALGDRAFRTAVAEGRDLALATSAPLSLLRGNGDAAGTSLDR